MRGSLVIREQRAASFPGPIQFFSYTASGGLGTRLGQHVHCSQVAFGDVFEVHVPALFSASAKDGRLGARLQARVHVD